MNHAHKHDPFACEVTECASTIQTGFCLRCGVKVCVAHQGEGKHPCKEWAREAFCLPQEDGLPAASDAGSKESNSELTRRRRTRLFGG